ncbi:MAG: hypothetical protein AMJ95_04895 [Omnitrophica WOR_2 bacterium SM23_72]|nr:MAG: hypothetical protein AMJ95_04895 [Omnitrophica WOR_2 bacterium SM23_72]
MKRLIVGIPIIILVILGSGIFFKPALTFFATKALERAFQTSDVHIASCRFAGLKQLAFCDIRIRKLESFDIKIKQAVIVNSLSSLLNRRILKFKLEDVSFGPLALKELELSHISIHIAPRKVQVLGDLSIPQIKYQKAKIGPLQAKLKIDDKVLYLDYLRAQIFNGKADGQVALNLDKEMNYQVTLNFTGLDIDRFIRDFDLEERFQMTGALSGEVSLRGSGATIQQIQGDLSTSQAGGKLTITDQRFLDNLARTSRQPLDILVESFKNYYYNIGIIKLGMEEGDLILDVRLDGEAGMRHLNIMVHEFNLRRR